MGVTVIYSMKKSGKKPKSIHGPFVHNDTELQELIAQRVVEAHNEANLIPLDKAFEQIRKSYKKKISLCNNIE